MRQEPLAIEEAVANLIKARLDYDVAASETSALERDACEARNYLNKATKALRSAFDAVTESTIAGTNLRHSGQPFRDVPTLNSAEPTP